MRIRLQGGIWDGVEFQANIAPAELRLRSFESTSEEFTDENLSISDVDSHIYVMAEEIEELGEGEELDVVAVYHYWPGDHIRWTCNPEIVSTQVQDQFDD